MINFFTFLGGYSFVLTTYFISYLSHSNFPLSPWRNYTVPPSKQTSENTKIRGFYLQLSYWPKLNCRPSLFLPEKKRGNFFSVMSLKMN